MFYERLVNLCCENSTNVSAVLKEMGLSTSKGTAWKGGSVPNGDILCKLAEYFRVSTDYLLGLTDDPAPVATIQPMAIDGVALSASELNLIRQFRMLPDDLSRGEVIGYISHMLREAPSAGEKAV